MTNAMATMTAEVQTPDRRQQMWNVFKWSVVSTVGMAVLGAAMMTPEGIIFALILLPIFLSYIYVRMLESYVEDLEVEIYN